jgi:hypothetical protein
MNFGALKRASEFVLLGSALLFLVILFFDWHRTTVKALVGPDLAAGSSGWSGWGLLAGVCAIALLGLEVDRMLRNRSHEGQALVDLALAIGVALATVAAVFTGDASVSAGAVGVEVASTLWPAWAGLVLASIIVVAALISAFPEADAGTPRAKVVNLS